MTELKAFGKKGRIHSVVFFLGLLALLLRNAKHRIKKKISNALLNLWWLPIQDFNIRIHADNLAEI